jgi:hypothetical protein
MSNLRKKIIFKTSALVIGITLLSPFTTTAHGIATSKQAIDGQYLMEFEYEALEQIPSQEPVGYTIRLLNNQTQADIAFDYACVSIQKDGRTVFNSHVAHAPDTEGIGRFATTLPDPGNYVASLTFLKDGKTLTKSSFNFTAISVRNDGADTKSPFGGSRQIALLATAMAIGLTLGLLLSTFFEK